MTSPPLFASVAPVFEVDGQVHGELARDVARLEVEHSTEGLKTLVLHLTAQGPVEGAEAQRVLYLDGAILDFGKTLAVSIGPADSARTIFKGEISAIEAEFAEGELPGVTVLAEDRLMQLRMTRRMRTYEQMSDADIASAVASEHGLTPDVAAPGPTYDVVQQLNTSDLAFLRERARRIRAELWVEDGTLGFKSRENRSGSAITLVMGNQLLDARIRADLAHQRTKVKLSGYDAQAREAIAEEAGDEAVQSELAGGRSGPATLQRAFGERVSYRVREVPLVAGEARDWAKAEMLRRARGFVTVVGTTSGTADMVVGSTLTLDGVGGPFSGGGYYATRVRHTYDLSSGHRTHFEAERPAIGAFT